MHEKRDLKYYFKIGKEYIIPICIGVLTCLNFYIGIKLNPVILELGDLGKRVEAVERSSNTCTTTFNEINTRLSRIEGAVGVIIK